MATTLVIEKSPLNPVQFVRELNTQSLAYHTLHQGQAIEYDTLLRGQDKVPYAYKAELSDILPLQFSYTYLNVGTLAIDLLQPLRTPTGYRWEAIYTWNPTTTVTTLVNNKVSVDGISYQQYTAQFNANLALISTLKPGYYRLRLRVTYRDLFVGSYNKTHSEISEWIEVRKSHPGTILIKAKNNSNDYNTVFVQTGITCGIRTEGALWGQALEGEVIVFTNQSGATKKLYDRPWETLNLTIGGKKGVPKWIKSAVTYYLACDYKSVDGISISKGASAKWEMVQASSPSYPLGGMNTQVELADGRDRYKTVLRPYVVVANLPSAYPYFVSRITLTFLSVPVYNVRAGVYVSDARTEADMLYQINRSVIALGGTGTFVRVGNELRYYNGENGAIDGATSKVLTKYFTFTSNGSTATVTAIITASEAAVVFDGGSTKVIGTGTPVTDSAVYSYRAASRNRSTLIFHDDNITALNVIGLNIISQSRALPIGIVDFAVHGTSITSFDFSVFVPVSATLFSIDLHDNAITTLLNTNVLGNGTTTPPFGALAVLSVASNALSVAQINQFLVNVDQMVHITSVSGGFLVTQFQSPTATPTTGPPNGVAAKADLITTYGWTVNTD